MHLQDAITRYRRRAVTAINTTHPESAEKLHMEQAARTVILQPAVRQAAVLHQIVRAAVRIPVGSYKPSSSSSKYNSSHSHDSYDSGYDDVYMDGDYDQDRYDRDDDYATGVDDAIEDDIEDGDEGDW